MHKIFFVALLNASMLAAAAPISKTTHSAIMLIADRGGIPRSVANWLQVEESGNRYTGTWGDAKAVSRREVRGYHSRGLYQIFEEPSNLNYLLDTFWDAKRDGVFDIENPVKNATLAFRYLAALHKQFGSWYFALCFYNSGETRAAPEETKAYALRIVKAGEP